GLVCGSCSSGRRFAAGFLQILRRRRHPCLKLTATATFTARDFHPRDSAHAGRTYKTPAGIKTGGVLRAVFIQEQ
ncbi:MAG: hypothetical protein ACOYEK_05845, partial [bacterium]